MSDATRGRTQCPSQDPEASPDASPDASYVTAIGLDIDASLRLLLGCGEGTVPLPVNTGTYHNVGASSLFSLQTYLVYGLSLVLLP